MENTEGRNKHRALACSQSNFAKVPAASGDQRVIQLHQLSIALTRLSERVNSKECCGHFLKIPRPQFARPHLSGFILRYQYQGEGSKRFLSYSMRRVQALQILQAKRTEFGQRCTDGNTDIRSHGSGA
ncbi:hypothetical protein TWF694_010328 [Orbilia ellipsospora]|uniref:Uncharacterized protein n=1 Tax=Orbilia ellipsospora TaxID=2528407 RepID=A0AAV9XFU4_9PEZI